MSINLDGLKLYVDAIDNTETGHGDAPATWYDLSGNKNGTNTRAAFGENYAQYSGNGYTVFGQINPTTEMTVEGFVSFDTRTSSGEGNAVIGNWESGGYGIQQKDGKNAVNVNVGGSWVHVYGSPCEINTPIHLCATYDGAAVRLYENGVLVSTVTRSGSIKAASNSTVVAIGGNPAGTYANMSFLSGKVYSARVYTRVLEGVEIAANYQYDLMRFFPPPPSPSLTKYMIRSGETLYTVLDGAAAPLPENTPAAALFTEYGIDETPSSDILKALVNPAVLKWTDAKEITPMAATVTGNPHSQTVETLVDMTSESIVGISSLTANYSGNVGIRYSVDEKATWSEEMPVSEFLNSDKDALFAAASGTCHVWFDFILHTGSKLTDFQIKFKN